MAGDTPKETPAKHELDVQHNEGGPFVQAVDATSMAMIVTDFRTRDNPIIFANAAFLRMTGYASEEVIGRNYRMLYGARTDPETARKVEDALNAKGDIVLETVLYRKDGRGLWVMHHVSVQYEAGEVKRHFASFFDIDRRVRAEREVRRAHGLLEQRVERRTRDLSRAVEDLRQENEKRKAAEEVLRNALADKEELLHQREFLVREVNHRVKNTLQVASSLLTIQAGVSPDQGIAAALGGAVGRLSRLADVHRLLYEVADVTMGVDLSSYLPDLCHHLMVANQGDSQRIRIEVDVEEGRWLADEAIPIALIVNEAITNALKHAFPHGRTGTIEVVLRDLGQGLYELVVADDGVGGEPSQKSGSLGMKLINTFARQLRGTLAIDRDAGTRLTVRFRHTESEPPRLAE